jgi:beta-ureidopropionase / N-carbamoyl-L-amino-acid hydrolase
MIILREIAMHEDWKTYRINTDRFLNDFAELSRIGSTGEGGVARPALSPADLEAREWFRRKVLDSGLEFRIDCAGNSSAFLPCGPEGAPVLMLGSHLDSVPIGGRYDGALGVLAALEVLRGVNEKGLSLPVNLEAINFTDEEGTLVGLLGSRALTGNLPEEMLANPKCGLEKLKDRLNAAGLSMDHLADAKRRKNSVAGYLELHIELGPRLEKAHTQIGIVTDITGLCAYRLVYHGRADHAGTTPLPDRLDAGLGASSFNLAAHELVVRDYAGCVVNVGEIKFEPGGYNVVPEKATLALEFRSNHSKQLVEMEMDLLKTARLHANRYGLLVGTERLIWEEPTHLPDAVQNMVRETAKDLGLTQMDLPSGAVHDAQLMSFICPSGMIFVPSVDGASHSPREFTREPDCINGANVLLQTALRMAYARNLDD